VHPRSSGAVGGCTRPDTTPGTAPPSRGARRPHCGRDTRDRDRRRTARTSRAGAPSGGSPVPVPSRASCLAPARIAATSARPGTWGPRDRIVGRRAVALRRTSVSVSPGASSSPIDADSALARVRELEPPHRLARHPAFAPRPWSTSARAGCSASRELDVLVGGHGAVPPGVNVPDVGLHRSGVSR
jgi:hypothetical protein